MASDKKIDDGGPANPTLPMIDGNGNTTPGSSGMSLRDWFAGQAMAAMLGCYRDRLLGERGNPANERDTDSFCRDLAIDRNHQTGECDGASEIADDAYVFADAMLKARKQPTT